MRFPSPLIPARLIRRYKRFLADCRLDDGREVTAHCANPGSMMGLAEPESLIWLEPNDDPKKKLKYGWRLVDHENGHFTGVDTSVPNRALRAEAAVAAEELVERKVATWTRRHQEGVTAPLVGDLQQTTRELLEKELSGLLSGRLAHLEDADRRALERWARGTFGKLMHQPVAALKRLAVELRENAPQHYGMDESEREPQPS